MTRLLVISDTHGDSACIHLALRAAGRVDALLHLGDGANDLPLQSLPTGTQYVCVRGNCDFYMDDPLERELLFDNRRIFMAHGHRYGVKSALDRIWLRAQDVQADLVCFGHTHQSLCELRGGILLLNPGSLRMDHTYALVEVDAEHIRPRLCRL